MQKHLVKPIEPISGMFLNTKLDSSELEAEREGRQRYKIKIMALKTYLQNIGIQRWILRRIQKIVI